MVSLDYAESLNPRQERFVTLVASGVPAGRAYEQAGYSSRGNAADVGASKLVRKPKVAHALEIERNANRVKSKLDRTEKLDILAEIARNAGAPGRVRIAAIKVHNEMTGDHQRRDPVENPLDEIMKRVRERVGDLRSPLAHPSALKLQYRRPE